MKKIIFSSIFLASIFFGYSQSSNTLLKADFWKGKPTLTQIKDVVAKGNNPAEQNGGFHDPVSMAINNGIANDAIIYLIEQEGNGVHKKTHHSRTYLQWAAAKGNLELVNYLINKGADIHYRDSYGTPVIAYAASSGNKNTAVYDVLFANGINPKAVYKDGANLIMYAIANDTDLSITNYFISKGIDLNAKDNYGRTVADYTLKLGNLDIVKQLISKGVQLTDQALFFATQGSRAKQNGIEVYDALLNQYKLNPKAINPDGETLLHVLATKPTTEVFDYFIAKGIDVSHQDANGNTALMNAAGGNNIKIVETLLSKKNNVNTVNENGITAISKAVASGTPEIVAFLIQQGADVAIIDNDGNTLAYYLFDSFRPARPGQSNANSKDPFTEKINLLKQAGLTFNKPQSQGTTLLHLAVDKGQLSLIKKAIELGVDINAQDTEGNSALHKAALIAKDDVILRELINLGIKKDLTTEFEETAYELASQNEFLKKNNVSIEFLK